MAKFTGVIGQTVFTVDDFTPTRELVYLNGHKLYRDIDYTAYDNGDAGPAMYNEISLDPGMFGVGIKYNDDILEVISVPDLADEIRDISAKLDDLLTATMGSWIWDKRNGKMTMFDATGLERFKYDISDSAEESKRERRQDLEIEEVAEGILESEPVVEEEVA